MGYDWQEFYEGAGGVAQDWFTGNADEALRVGKGAPGVGSFVSGVTSAYHLGSAVYDGVTGDRDGAIAHGSQALVNGLSAIPGVGSAIGGIDTALGITGSAARYGNTVGGEKGKGIEPGDIPTGLDDVVAAEAVGMTNLLFGKDDSNLIAKGDTPQGTRHGEIAHGISAAAPLALGLLGPLGSLASPFVSDAIGEAGADLFAPMGEAKPGDSKKVGSTSGAEPGYVAREMAKLNGKLPAIVPGLGQPGMMMDPSTVPSIPGPAQGNPTPGMGMAPGIGPAIAGLGQPGMQLDPSKLPAVSGPAQGNPTPGMGMAPGIGPAIAGLGRPGMLAPTGGSGMNAATGTMTPTAGAGGAGAGAGAAGGHVTNAGAAGASVGGTSGMAPPPAPKASGPMPGLPWFLQPAGGLFG